MKISVSTGLIIIAMITILSVLALFVRTGATADSVAVLKTTGMTCGSCASRITTALGSVKGVAVTEVDVAGGWVVVSYDTKDVKPERLAEKINGAGFDSKVQRVLTPEQYRQMTGRDLGMKVSAATGCGCCANK